MNGASAHTWLRRVSDYHSGGVSTAERAAVEAHLAGCAECRQALATYRRFYTLARSPLQLGDSGEGPLTEYRLVTQEEIMITNDRDQDTPGSTTTRRRPRASLTALGAIAAILVVAILAGALFALHGGLSSLTPTPPLPSASEVLSNALLNLPKDASFTVSLKGENPDPTPGTGKLTTSPMRQEILSGLSASQPTGRFRDFTASGSYYYKNPGEANWNKANADDFFAGDNAEAMVLFINFVDYRQLQAVTVIGAETIGGAPTWHLRGTLPLTGVAQQAAAAFNLKSDVATEDLWVRQSDAKPAKLMFFFPRDTSRNPIATDFTMTVSFTTWNTGLTLPVPPNPVPVG
jgi:hypothetical protein